MEFRQLFFAESIRPSHMGGYDWDLEAVNLAAFTIGGFNEQAGGHTSTKWGARLKIKRWKKQFTKDAAEVNQGAEAA